MDSSTPSDSYQKSLKERARLPPRFCGSVMASGGDAQPEEISAGSRDPPGHVR